MVRIGTSPVTQNLSKKVIKLYICFPLSAFGSLDLLHWELNILDYIELDWIRLCDKLH